MASATYECVNLAKWEHLAVSFPCVGKMGIDELGIGDLKIGEPSPPRNLLYWFLERVLCGWGKGWRGRRNI